MERAGLSVIGKSKVSTENVAPPFWLWPIFQYIHNAGAIIIRKYDWWYEWSPSFLPFPAPLLPRSLPPPPSPSYSITTIISQPKNLYTFFMFAKVEVQFSIKPPQQSNIQK